MLVKDDRVRETEVTPGDNAAAQEAASEAMTVPVEDAYVQGIAPEAVIDPGNVVTAATIVKNTKSLYLSMSVLATRDGCALLSLSSFIRWCFEHA